MTSDTNTAQIRNIIDDPAKIRDAIYTGVKDALRRKFPIEGRHFRAEISNIVVDHQPLTHNRQREILMAKGSAYDPVYADIAIINKASGKRVETLKRHRILNIPYYTNRYTFLVGGNEYQIVNQLRTKSGVYTRKRGNDELESSFNLAKGANFKLIMEPDTGKFKVSILNSTVPLAAVLKILGARPSDIEQRLGAELYRANSSVSPTQQKRTIDLLYSKLAQYGKNSGLGDTASAEEKSAAIRSYFSGTEIDSETTKITLGNAYSSVGASTLLDAATKILKVYNDDEDVDERDNLEFQKIFAPEDIIKEVLEKDTSALTKIRSKLDKLNPASVEIDRNSLKSTFSPLHMTKPLKSFLSTSNISRLPSQINPMEMVDGAAIVTRLGEGAISSEMAVPDETRAVNYSYLGVIDPISTPESGKIGIDNRFSMFAKKGSDNELYLTVRNTKTGQKETKRLIELRSKIVGYPDELHGEDKRKENDNIPAVSNGRLVKVKRSELDYQILTPHSMMSVASNSLPFVNANQANRIVMGSKHIQQAMPLVERDTRLVESVIRNEDGKKISTMSQIGSFLLPKSPVDGKVTKVDDDFIYIRANDNKVYKVEYENNLPLATKTLLHNDVTVKAGDTVTAGQILAGSNFTRDNKLALGRNLNVAYVPYQGMNHEDGIVISESAAKKLSSVHADRVSVELGKGILVDKNKFTAAFPTAFTLDQLKKVDNQGVVTKGTRLEKGDPIVLVLADNSDSASNQVLGRLHKNLITPFRDESEVYDGNYPAEVLEVHKSNRRVTVLLKSTKPAVVGDKLTGSYGGKGVITKILPDSEMLKDEEDNPLDVLMTPAGVPGRINPAQILESTLGKIAKKTGKPYEIENFSTDNYIDLVKKEMKTHQVKDKETLTDPITGKKIPQIFTGVQHIHKVFKTTDTNFAARGIEGPYDQDESPSGSGFSGPKAMGGMEVNALIAHNARNLLREGASLRNSKNTEFWRNFQNGTIAHFPTEKKTFNKFTGILQQAGIKTERSGDQLIMGPLTDKDILNQSAGEITNARLLDYNHKPERGGLFDENRTGGLAGNKWSHVKLVEPVVNPVFEEPSKVLLGLSTADFQKKIKVEGGNALRKELNSLDINKELKAAEKELDNPKLKNDALDKQVRKVKYLRTLADKNLKAGDAYTLSVLPVTPPTLRPITIGRDGSKMENDANYLYRDLVLQNESFKDIKKAGLDDEDIQENREELYNRVKELTGTMSPSSPFLANRGVKGALRYIAGDVPKEGYFQRKVIYSKMNMTGRATITPDNTLGLDDVGLPEEMAWNMYKPFIIRRLTQMGYGAVEAREAVDERNESARSALQEELQKRPVLVNRAPTLWRYSTIAAKPTLRSGTNLQINTLWEKGLNSDFDGDSILNSIYYRDLRDSEKSKKSKLLLNESGERTQALSLTLNDGESAMPFTDDTKIRFTNGLINMKDFPRVEESKRMEGRNEVYDVPEGIEVQTVRDGKIEWLPVESFHIHRGLTMVEVKTHTSRALHCSTDNSIITLDDHLNYIEDKPRVGVVMPRLREICAPHGTELTSITMRNGEAKEVSLNLDFGYLNGAFIGDGWVNKTVEPQYIMLASVHPGLRDKYEGVIREIAGADVMGSNLIKNRHDFNGHDSYSEKLNINCLPLANYFRENVGLGAGNKHLPDFWLESPESFRWGLLSGLIDTDGTVTLVKAKAKKHPQTQVSYTTTSRRLAFEVVALAHSLDLTATCSFSKTTVAGNEALIVSFNYESISKMQHKLTLYNPNKAEKLAAAIIPDSLDSKKYAPPLPEFRYVELAQALPTKRVKTKKGELRFHGEELEKAREIQTLYSTLKQLSKKRLPMSLAMAKRLVDLLPEFFTADELWAKWKTMVLDDRIEWEIIKEIRPLPHITEAYDLTIPPAYTMVTECGFVVFDSMQVHLPITDEAIEDANKMLPSQLVFSDRKRGDLLYTPTNEPIVGLYKATKNLGSVVTGQAKKFKSVAEAWQAYHKGELKMTDPVQIG